MKIAQTISATQLVAIYRNAWTNAFPTSAPREEQGAVSPREAAIKALKGVFVGAMPVEMKKALVRLSSRLWFKGSDARTKLGLIQSQVVAIARQFGYSTELLTREGRLFGFSFTVKVKVEKNPRIVRRVQTPTGVIVYTQKGVDMLEATASNTAVKKEVANTAPAPRVNVWAKVGNYLGRPTKENLRKAGACIKQALGLNSNGIPVL